jgi:hypothetical protein
MEEEEEAVELMEEEEADSGFFPPKFVKSGIGETRSSNKQFYDPTSFSHMTFMYPPPHPYLPPINSSTTRRASHPYLLLTSLCSLRLI